MIYGEKEILGSTFIKEFYFVQKEDGLELG